MPDNDQAIYFENQSPNEFAKLILDHLANSQALSGRAAKAKAVYKAKFSQDQIVDNFISHAENRFKLRFDLN